jgi:hypothetical protein
LLCRDDLIVYLGSWRNQPNGFGPAMPLIEVKQLTVREFHSASLDSSGRCTPGGTPPPEKYVRIQGGLVTSVGKLGQPAPRSRPSRTCWECETPSVDLVDVSLPVPSVSVTAVRLCTPCFTTFYLPLAVGVPESREAASRSFSTL